jgi:hypothetical protein
MEVFVINYPKEQKLCRTNIHLQVHINIKSLDRMVVGFTTMQSVPITTDVVNSNLDQGEVFNIM